MIADPSVSRGTPSVAPSFREEQQAATVNEAETSRYVLARGRGTVDHAVDEDTAVSGGPICTLGSWRPASR